MKVILKEDVNKLGYEGDLVDVKDGYARNFLFPKGIAVLANKENLAQWELDREAREARHAENLKAAQELKEKIENTEIQIAAKSGEEGKLFGAVTSQVVADKLSEKGIEVDRKKIDMENIKSLGKHEVTIRLFKEIAATAVVEVVEE